MSESGPITSLQHGIGALYNRAEQLVSGAAAAIQRQFTKENPENMMGKAPEESPAPAIQRAAEAWDYKKIMVGRHVVNYPNVIGGDEAVSRMSPEQVLRLAEEINHAEGRIAHFTAKDKQRRNSEPSADVQDSPADRPQEVPEAYTEAQILETEAEQWFETRSSRTSGWHGVFVELHGAEMVLRRSNGGEEIQKLDLGNCIIKLQGEEHPVAIEIWSKAENKVLVELQASAVTHPPDLKYWCDLLNSKSNIAQKRRHSV